MKKITKHAGHKIAAYLILGPDFTAKEVQELYGCHPATALKIQAENFDFSDFQSFLNIYINSSFTQEDSYSKVVPKSKRVKSKEKQNLKSKFLVEKKRAFVEKLEQPTELAAPSPGLLFDVPTLNQAESGPVSDDFPWDASMLPDVVEDAPSAKPSPKAGPVVPTREQCVEYLMSHPHKRLNRANAVRCVDDFFDVYENTELPWHRRAGSKMIPITNWRGALGRYVSTSRWANVAGNPSENPTLAPPTARSVPERNAQQVQLAAIFEAAAKKSEEK